MPSHSHLLGLCTSLLSLCTLFSWEEVGCKRSAGMVARGLLSCCRCCCCCGRGKAYRREPTEIILRHVRIGAETHFLPDRTTPLSLNLSSFVRPGYPTPARAAPTLRTVCSVRPFVSKHGRAAQHSAQYPSRVLAVGVAFVAAVVALVYR